MCLCCRVLLQLMIVRADETKLRATQGDIGRSACMPFSRASLFYARNNMIHLLSGQTFVRPRRVLYWNLRSPLMEMGPRSNNPYQPIYHTHLVMMNRTRMKFGKMIALSLCCNNNKFAHIYVYIYIYNL